MDSFEKLKEAKQLFDDGIITEEEFNKKKDLLLNEPLENVNTPESIDKTITEKGQSINGSNVGETHIDSKKPQNKKAIIIGAIVAAVILLVLIGGSSGLNKDEKYVLDCLKTVSDGNSLTISDAYVVHHEYDDGDEVKYAVVTYTGTNSYGSVIAGTAIFQDGYYLMDSNDYFIPDGSDESIEKAIALRNIGIASSDEIGEVDVSKINKALEKL